MLTLLAGGLAASALTGCGGGGSGNNTGQSGATSSGTIVTGSVDRAQIGGTGLTVVSAYQQTAPVSSSGTFSSTGAPGSAHLLFLSDGAGALRGLALWNPGASKATRGVQSLVFNAVSTATGLLMALPGILTTDTTEAVTRVAQIQSLHSFTPLVTLLGQLTSTSLTALAAAADGVLAAAVQAAVNEWMATVGKVYAPFPFSAQTTSANPAQATILLTNSGWRYVAVTRQLLDGSGNQIGPLTDLTFPLYNITASAMEGAKGASLGDLFTQQAFASHTEFDTVNFSGSVAAASISYWVRGFGTNKASVPLPPGLTSSDAEALGLTVVQYILSPIIEACGALPTNTNTEYLVASVWDGVKGGIDLTDWTTAVASGNLSAILPLAINLISSSICADIQAFVAGLVAVGIIGSETALVPIAAAALITVLELYCGVKLALAAAEAVIAATAWIQYPETMVVTVPMSTTGGIGTVSVS